MKANKVLLRTAMAVAIMFGCQQTANAQFGNLINKAAKTAKTKAEGTAKTMANKAMDKAEEKARKKMWEIVKKKVLNGKQMPEQPWPMTQEAFFENITPPQQGPENNITYYLYNLGKEDPAAVKQLKDQLDARYEANKKIILAESTGLFSQLGGYTNSLLGEVHKEQEKWEEFYGQISQHVMLHVMGGKITGTTKEDMSLTTELGDVVIGSAAVYVAKSKEKNKCIFYSTISQMATYVNDENMAKVKDELKAMENILILLEGLDTELDSPGSTPENGHLLLKDYLRTRSFVNQTTEAISTNSPSNIAKKAMPKAGSLNASLKAKALAIAKSDMKNVVDVVITSNSWEIKREGGVIKNRVVYGYVITQEANGKMAHSRSWCQGYQGGGKYGALRHFGVGIEEFYVK